MAKEENKAGSRGDTEMCDNWFASEVQRSAHEAAVRNDGGISRDSSSYESAVRQRDCSRRCDAIELGIRFEFLRKGLKDVLCERSHQSLSIAPRHGD